MKFVHTTGNFLFIFSGQTARYHLCYQAHVGCHSNNANLWGLFKLWSINKYRISMGFQTIYQGCLARAC